MKQLLSILLLLFGFCSINAQTTYTLEQLVGTKWSMIYPKEVENHPYSSFIEIREFTANEVKTNYKRVSKVNGEIRSRLNFSKPYYLSDVIPKSFDNSKVGKVKKGSYIILYNDKIKAIEYYKIISLTNDSLKLFHKASKDEIRNVWVDFVRVK